MVTLDKRSAGFWKECITPGKTVIHLSDEQTLMDAMKAGKGMGGEDFVVQRLRRVRESHGLFEYVFIDLGSRLWLVAKLVDEVFDLRVYEEIDNASFSPGNRADMIRNERYWLFEAPKTDPFVYNDLRFTYSLNYAVEVDGRSVDFEYRRKDQGETYGDGSTLPQPAGLPERLMAVVVEYQADVESATGEKNPNPEIMLLELGGEDVDEGGLIIMLVGANIKLTEVDAL